MLRTPDALMNGQGVVSVIESCVPAITNAWAMPSIDMDAILIAIRIATYGEGMDIDSTCPQCNHENRHRLDLNPILLRVRSPDFSETVSIDELIIKLKPLNYMQSNRSNINSFEEQKIIQLINDDDVDGEVKKFQLDQHLKNVVNNSIAQLTDSTESITTSDGEKVTDKNFIAEFYTNASNATIKAVQQKLRDFAEVAGLPPARVQCEECSHDYNVAVTFDYANFFEPLS